MAQSSIEWTGKVWNPVTGCNKISQGCKNCYAEKMHKRLKGMGQKKYQRDFLEGAFSHDESLPYPLKIKKPTTFFVNSMSDLFHEAVPFEYIRTVFGIMSVCKQHTFQVLTKRHERMPEFFKWRDERDPEFMDDPAGYAYDVAVEAGIETGCGSAFETDSWPLKNVWMGMSIEDQDNAVKRIPYLLETPAAVRWLSMEPLLGPVDLHKVPGAERLNWIVVGGESGHKRRPFDPDWARSIRDYCELFNIPFFMKQWDKVKEVPEDLQIRQFPHETTN